MVFAFKEKRLNRKSLICEIIDDMADYVKNKTSSKYEMFLHMNAASVDNSSRKDK